MGGWGGAGCRTALLDEGDSFLDRLGHLEPDHHDCQASSVARESRLPDCSASAGRAGVSPRRATTAVHTDRMQTL